MLISLFEDTHYVEFLKIKLPSPKYRHRLKNFETRKIVTADSKILYCTIVSLSYLLKWCCCPFRRYQSCDRHSVATFVLCSASGSGWLPAQSVDRPRHSVEAGSGFLDPRLDRGCSYSVLSCSLLLSRHQLPTSSCNTSSLRLQKVALPSKGALAHQL